MAAVRCPDCGEIVSVPEGAKAGDLVECPNCAGHALRLRVTFDPAQVGVDQLVEAVTRAGFRASLKRNGA